MAMSKKLHIRIIIINDTRNFFVLSNDGQV